MALSTPEHGGQQPAGRAAAPAPRPCAKAVPSANGSRLVNSSVAEPTPNQSVPQPRGLRARSAPRASSVKHAVAATADERAHELRPQQPAQRRREHRVGGRVVAAVPLAVPDREALAAEQLGAEEVRRQVGRARLDDQVDDGERGGQQRGREPPPVEPRQRGTAARLGTVVGRVGRGLGGRLRGGAATEKREPRHAVRLAARPAGRRSSPARSAARAG